MRPDFEQTLSRRAFVIATLGSIASAACASKTPERRTGKEIEQPQDELGRPLGVVKLNT